MTGVVQRLRRRGGAAGAPDRGRTTPRRPLQRGGIAVAYETVVCLLVGVVVELGVRLVPLPRVARALGVRLSETVVPASPPIVLPRWSKVRLDAAWRITSRWPAGPAGKCLRTSLVAGHRLRRLRPEMVIGVRRQGTTTEAHAWLVVAGGSLDPSSSLYVQLPFRAA